MSTGNCNKCDPTLCLVCKQGQCQECVSFAIKSQKNCLVCNPDQFFDILQNKCVSCTKNCLDCSQVGVCLQCRQNYVLEPTLNVCIPTTKCEEGISLVFNQVECVSLPDNCFLAGEDLSCRQCKQGYFLINGICQDCINNCLVCFDYKICLQCTDSFVFDQSLDKCVEKLTLSHFSNSKSSLSFSPFFLPNLDLSSLPFLNESLFFKRRDPNCVSFDVKGICMICRLGYYLGLSNNCHICEENCRVCRGPSLCVSCKDQFDPVPQDNGYFRCLPKKVKHLYQEVLV